MRPINGKGRVTYLRWANIGIMICPRYAPDQLVLREAMVCWGPYARSRDLEPRLMDFIGRHNLRFLSCFAGSSNGGPIALMFTQADK